MFIAIYGQSRPNAVLKHKFGPLVIGFRVVNKAVVVYFERCCRRLAVEKLFVFEIGQHYFVFCCLAHFASLFCSAVSELGVFFHLGLIRNFWSSTL